MTTARRLLVLLALAASVLAVQSASASNSPNMRIDYSLIDTFQDRTHSDIAFWGNIAVAGNYDGFRVFNTDTHQLIVSFLCRGPQNDVSLWSTTAGFSLFLSNDTPQTNGATVCGQNRQSDTTACGPACFEGIRIFDLTDPRRRIHRRRLHELRLAHAHARPGPREQPRAALRLLVPVEHRAELPVAAREDLDRRRAAEAPETASVIATPTIDAPAYIGVGCHDITVFMAIHKAAASCQTRLRSGTSPTRPTPTHSIRCASTAPV